MATTSVKVDPKGRLTIPRQLREQLNIESGDTLFVEADEEHNVLRYVKAENPFETLARHALAERAAGRTRTLARVFARGDRLMAVQFILTDYVDQALASAAYDKLEDGTFAGRVPECPGAVAFGMSLRACEDELRSTLEDWILVGLKQGHPMPIVAGIDLNKEPTLEPLDSL
ncbi:MAG: AbrB/MazE/SpoVT family DNA-binding domain-containing protein [Thermomicrobiales bacterium]